MVPKTNGTTGGNPGTARNIPIIATKTMSDTTRGLASARNCRKRTSANASVVIGRRRAATGESRGRGADFTTARTRAAGLRTAAQCEPRSRPYAASASARPCNAMAAESASLRRLAQVASPLASLGGPCFPARVATRDRSLPHGTLRRGAPARRSRRRPPRGQVHRCANPSASCGDSRSLAPPRHTAPWGPGSPFAPSASARPSASLRQPVGLMRRLAIARSPTAHCAVGPRLAVRAATRPPRRGAGASGPLRAL